MPLIAAKWTGLNYSREECLVCKKMQGSFLN
jgi:hypothetical protein